MNTEIIRAEFEAMTLAERIEFVESGGVIFEVPRGMEVIFTADAINGFRVGLGFVAGLVFGTLGTLFVLKGWPL